MIVVAVVVGGCSPYTCVDMCEDFSDGECSMPGCDSLCSTTEDLNLAADCTDAFDAWRECEGDDPPLRVFCDSTNCRTEEQAWKACVETYCSANTDSRCYSMREWRPTWSGDFGS